MERNNFPWVTQLVSWWVGIRISMVQHMPPSSHSTVRLFFPTYPKVTQSSVFFQGWTSAYSFRTLRDNLHFIQHRIKWHSKTPNKSWKEVQDSSESALWWAWALTGLKVGSVSLSGTKAIEVEKRKIKVISPGNLALSSHKIFYLVWPL